MHLVVFLYESVEKKSVENPFFYVFDYIAHYNLDLTDLIHAVLPT